MDFNVSIEIGLGFVEMLFEFFFTLLALGCGIIYAIKLLKH